MSCELAQLALDPGSTGASADELESRASVLVATSNPNNRDHPPQHDNSDPENDN